MLNFVLNTVYKVHGIKIAKNSLLNISQGYWTGVTWGYVTDKNQTENKAPSRQMARLTLSQSKERSEEGDGSWQKLLSSRRGSMSVLEEELELDADWEVPRVVIVGGGLAGLAAAHRLSHSGINNYVLLEAADRPGGRIMTAWLGDVVVEIGAEWIHGGSLANPAYVLASMENLISGGCGKVCDPWAASQPRPLYVTTEGRQLDDTTLEEAVFDEILRAVKTDCSKVSLAHYLGLRINQELANFSQDRRYDGERALYGMIEGLKTSIGADLKDVSLRQVSSDRTLPGGDVRVSLGMIGILAPLLKLIPIENVRYNSQVTKIEWCQDGLSYPRALVRTADGTEYKADYVIITLPLGVLKSSPSLFYPELPEEKLEAINKLGFGRIEHIYAEYSRPWWACPVPMRMARSAYETNCKEDWTNGINNITPKDGSTHILSTTVSGHDAVLLDEVVEESIAVDLTKTIRKFTGDSTIPYPVNILRSKWGSNPYFRGSSTYYSLESSEGLIKDMILPIPEPCVMVAEGGAPTLLFAGEATCLLHFGTVHGAIHTGIREAERVIRFTKQFQGLPACAENNTLESAQMNN